MTKRKLEKTLHKIIELQVETLKTIVANSALVQKHIRSVHALRREVKQLKDRLRKFGKVTKKGKRN